VTDQRPGFLDTSRVAEFWDEARKSADEDKQSGYLQDEWPTALGMNRFAGEWKLIKRWLDAANVRRGSCLDVGCGVGLWLEKLASHFERADGIDLSREMVASTAKRLAHVPNVRVEVMGVADLPADRRYDFIFVGGVLMYVNDEQVESVIAKLSSMLAPNGVLVFRESTANGKTWYRDTPLGRGLFADPAKPRPPYFAIYRTPDSYPVMIERNELTLVRKQPNKFYKLADVTETWLKLFNKILFGRLARRRDSAERAARWLHRLRCITLVPHYYIVSLLARRSWRLNNYWYVCARRSGESSSSASR
jgi:2-polyprenyl-3-methyl-5-hydroxy-6-metoxy-1,4-benzoquinol methylase